MRLKIGLGLYVGILGLLATGVLIGYFPTQDNGKLVFPCQCLSPEQGLLCLAGIAGVAGSFIHSAQSLATYYGNDAFKPSWASWYLLRPWIGGVLGVAIYVALRAGLLAPADSVNPYGIVAIGLLGGWFSKTTTDKLQEVFETMFKTEADRKRKDKLQAGERPIVNSLSPSPVPATVNLVSVAGESFSQGARVLIDGTEVPAEFVSSAELRFSLTSLAARPAAGSRVAVRVRNPGPDASPSEAQQLVIL